MENSENKFQLDFRDGKIQVQRHSVGGQVVFRVAFSDGRAPLILTRANHANAHKFWTSIPEGRQDEADQVGPLISEYYKSIP